MLEKGNFERELELYEAVDCEISETIKVYETNKDDTIDIILRKDDKGIITVSVFIMTVILIDPLRNSTGRKLKGKAKLNVPLAKPFDFSMTIDDSALSIISEKLTKKGVFSGPSDAQKALDFINSNIKVSPTDFEFEYPKSESEYFFGKKKIKNNCDDKVSVDKIPLVNNLQEGDIIVSTTTDIISAIIRTLSGSKVSHSALYIGNGEIIEAIGKGVTRKPLEKALVDDKYAYVLRYPGLEFTQTQIIKGYAIKQYNEGKKFDKWGLVKTGLWGIFKIGQNKPGEKSELRYYCSELILNAYKLAGIELFESTQRRPGDIEELCGSKLDLIGYVKSKENELESFYEMGNEYDNYENFDFDYETVKGTDIDFSDLPSIDSNQIKTLDLWYSKLKEYVLGELKEKAAEEILRAILTKGAKAAARNGLPVVASSLLAADAGVAGLFWFLGYFSLAFGIPAAIITQFIKHKNTGVSFACLKGICYAIVSRCQNLPQPKPPVSWDKKLKEAYDQGADYINKLYNGNKSISPLVGIEKMKPIPAVNQLFGFFGKLLYYDRLDQVRWNLFKELGNLTWPVDNDILDHEFESEFETLKNNTMEKNCYELDELNNDYEDFEDYEDDEYEDYEDDEYEDDEYEYVHDEYEDYEDNEAEERYAERLEELANESFESEYELEAAIDNELDELQRRYIEKPAKEEHNQGKRGRRKPRGRHGKGRRKRRGGLFGKIAKAGIKVLGNVAKNTPIGSVIKAGADLATGNFKGMAKNLAKGAIGMAMPGIGTVASAALDAVVPEEGGEGEVRRRRRRAAKRVAKITSDGFRELANNLPDDLEDREAVYEASKDAMRRAMARNGVKPQRPMPGREKDPSDKGGGKRIIRLNPGEQVLIIRPRIKQ